MSKSSTNSKFSFDPEGVWSCSWQDKYGGGGNLEHCLDTVCDYITNNSRDIGDVRQQLLRDGYANGYWWSIWYEEDELEDEWEKEDLVVSDEETTCYLYEDAGVYRNHYADVRHERLTLIKKAQSPEIR